MCVFIITECSSFTSFFNTPAFFSTFEGDSTDDEVILRVLTVGGCASICYAGVDCVGFAYSTRDDVCILLRAYEFPPPADALPGYVYYQRTPMGVNLFERNDIVDGLLSTRDAQGLTLPAFPVVGSTFGVALSFRQHVGEFGYLFAKTNNAGNIRHYALYSTRSGTACDFFYTIETRGVRFLLKESIPVALSDGRQHTVNIFVESGVLYFTLDSNPPIARLLLRWGDRIDDCASTDSDCVLTVGKRPSGSNPAGAFFFEGSIDQFHVFPSSANLSAMQATLTAARPRITVTLIASSTVFRGTTGIVLAAQNVFVRPTMEFTVDMQALAGTSGYIFAKTDASGALRYATLYTSRLAVRLYYVVGGVLRLSTFSTSVTDGQRHTMVLTVNNTAATLAVDPGTVLYSRSRHPGISARIKMNGVILFDGLSAGILAPRRHGNATSACY